MLVSTRGRYAIRVMIDLAEHRHGKFIPMKEIADRQEVSLKYMTKIMQALTKSGLLDGQHGKGGGYKLNREPADYRQGADVADIGDVGEQGQGVDEGGPGRAPARQLEGEHGAGPARAIWRNLLAFANQGESFRAFFN